MLWLTGISSSMISRHKPDTYSHTTYQNELHYYILLTYYISMSKEGKDLRCPYCESLFATKEELSKHIDKIHIGPGVLEGDTRKL